MIVYQPWYDNGMPYDQHYQYPSDKVYTTLERAEFEVFEEGVLLRWSDRWRGFGRREFEGI